MIKRKCLFITFFAVSIIIGKSILFSDEEKITNLIIDLQVIPGTYIDSIPIGKIGSVTFKNVWINRNDYEFVTKKHSLQIPPISLSEIGAEKKDASCDKLAEVFIKYDALNDDSKVHIESKIAMLLNEMESEMKSCNDDELKNKAKEIIEYSKINFPLNGFIAAGDELIIKITRGKYKWIFLYREESISKRGSWLTSYGLSYIIPTNVFIKKSERKRYASYSLDPSNKGSGYMLYRDDDYSMKDMTPIILFSWMPTNKLEKDLCFSLTGGLSVDLTEPTLFLGGSAIYNSNLFISVGMTAHKRTRLKSKYWSARDNSDNIVVTEMLDFDQLHDSVIKPGFFASLTFRFDSNPFKSKKEESTQEKGGQNSDNSTTSNENDASKNKNKVSEK